MANKKKNHSSDINISPEAIATIAGSAAIECYGVVGLSAQNSFGQRVDDLLGKKNFKQGVICQKDKKNNNYYIDLYIVVASQTKITEVIVEIQKRVSYVLEKTFGIQFKNINVYVQGVVEE